MTERDDDIEFDFFDDPEPTEVRPEARRPVRPAGPPPGAPPRRARPRMRPPTGGAPLFRLVGLVVFAIFVVVLLVFLVHSCRGTSKRSTYRNYLQELGGVGRDSQQIGRELNDLLTTRGLRFTELEQRLAGLARQQQQDVARAQQIDPPGPLRAAQEHAIQALQIRVSGLNGLRAEFRRTATTNDDVANATRLAQQAKRLDASDVIWDDLFRTPAVTTLQTEGVGGVPVPDSNFVQFPDFSSTRTWVSIIDRLKPGPTTGLRGTSIVVTRALPSGTELTRDEDNTVVASTDLAFEVVVMNSGESQEVEIQVTLTIQQRSPIVKRATIPLINAGEERTVTFRDIGSVEFARRTTVRVDIRPVPGETNPDNNSAQYPVIFSLG